MNVIDGGSLLGTLALWLMGAIALAVAVMYFLRPLTRAAYPGGPRRYLLAITLQTVAFLVPIPIVIFLLAGRFNNGFDVIVAVAVGMAVVIGLRALPVTGPLLTDLHRARIEAAIQRLGPKT
jgi:hypothetical protein